MNLSDWKSAHGAAWARSTHHSSGVVWWKLFAEKYGERTPPVTVTVTTPAAAALWLAAHFSEADCADPARTWALELAAEGITVKVSEKIRCKDAAAPTVNTPISSGAPRC